MENVNALYMRLSMADGDLGKDNKDESNSIENQRMMLQNFVTTQEDLGETCEEYIDDGYSGTNFNRPAFKRMIEDAKAGRIHTIIVKDFSRLGRDFIENGDYLEQIFPVLGIRFISVNNNYDSASEENIGKTLSLDMVMSNLVNSLYSKDLSRKLKSALLVRWKNGIPTSGRAPFGYSKVEGTRKWEIDPEAAKYVRMIFDLALEGKNTSQIVYALNENKIPTPGQYNYEKKNIKGSIQFITPESERLWDTSMLLRILQRYEYTGAVVQGKRETLFVGSNKTRVNPERNRFVIENYNPAIVTVEEYEKANAVVRTVRKANFTNARKYPLKGKLRCGNCNHALVFVNSYQDKLVCRHKQSVGFHSECSSEAYVLSELESKIFYVIKKHLTYVKELQGKKHDIECTLKKSAKKQVKQKELSLDQLKAERIRQYEGYAEGLISKDIYIRKKQALTEQIDQIQNELTCLYDNLAGNTNDAVGNAVETLSVFEGNDQLDREMVDAVIENVFIYDKKHIKVVFRFEDLIQQAAEKYDRNTDIQEDENDGNKGID